MLKLFLYFKSIKGYCYKQEENESCRIKLDDAANAIMDLQKIVVDVKEEYTKLADEKKMNETAFEAKLKENSNF